ncbi:DNA repair protein rad9 [Colletotrichum truncatum]|uniref:DNA repair protein rad9 n=1 Tax=Colletotrichum truncatum TaxID=5467 RepID=A0ACC3YHI9_COLTU|nr:DNA repair protein rad9 [Colletotrichum truncatum]KAF6792894.1 DNA repair protein rad9 [Colletotrichum truncatum]
MAILNFTLSEDAVAAFRDVLTCLNKFSDEVSLEAKKDQTPDAVQLVLSTLNSSKSAYACFTLTTARFCSRYQFEGSAQYRDKFHCKLYTRALISIFRSRSAGDPLRDRERESSIDHCDVAIQDGPGIKSRFIVRLYFRNGITSTHYLSFEVTVPVRATFDKNEAVNHWKIPSRTLRQLMDHFGPGIDYLEVNSDGEHVNFVGTTEKTTNGDEVLKKPLHTSIAIEVDEFEDIEVEEKLRIVVSVKDFRAIILHAGITGTHLSAKYSTPARPIQFAYQGDGINCEFLLMTVGERGNPSQKTKKGKANNKAAPRQQQLEAAAGSRRQSAAPSEPPEKPATQAMPPPPAASAARSGAARTSLFDLRPSQRPPPATMRSEGLFVDNDQEWEPMRDEDDEEAEEEARLEWDHSNQPVSPRDYPGFMNHMLTCACQNTSSMHLGRSVAEQNGEINPTPASSFGLAPTQPLSDVKRLGLFYRE